MSFKYLNIGTLFNFNSNYIQKNYYLKFDEKKLIKTLLKLGSIFGYDNKRFTISVFPASTAIYISVLLKKNKIKTSFKKNFL